MPVRNGYMPVKKALRPEVHGEIVNEDCAFLSDAVDVGRFADHQAAVIDARLHPADIVTHDEEDVWFLTLSLRLRGLQSDPEPAGCKKRCTDMEAQFVFERVYDQCHLPDV